MANDKLQDVFPIAFNFVKGEQPTAQKLTGLVKNVDSGFSKMGQAIGDPWSYQAQTYELSNDKLGISNLSRAIGPMDWISPTGASWNEQTGHLTQIDLEANRNSWDLGFPLIKKLADITPTSQINSVFTTMNWSSDIQVMLDGDDVLSSIKASEDLVVSDGDFYVDYYKGRIIAYKTSSSIIALWVSSSFSSSKDFIMAGAGVPWGNHNVIPSWKQTGTLCESAFVSTSSEQAEWTITFPAISNGQRITSNSNNDVYGAARPYVDASTRPSNVMWSPSVSGYGASYRLPHAITSQFSSGETVPEGYMLLWDEAQGRIVQQVTFVYNDENSITVYTPAGSPPNGWLTESTSRYRVVVPGTSLTEAVGWLMSAFRDNRHVGLTNGSSSDKNLCYTAPLSHNDLSDLYTDAIDASLTDVDRYKFRKSDYPTNPHPQYLHRGGWMANDFNGNSANAMRGNLVFTGDVDDDFALGGGGSAGTRQKTYGIWFGGGYEWSYSSTNNQYSNTKISFEGGNGLSSWTSGVPEKLAFGEDVVGANTWGAEANGALAYRPIYGTPLYLRGRGNGSGRDLDYSGATLGFDLSQQGEVNYMKLFPAIRSGSSDVANMPAEVSQTATSALDIAPALGNLTADSESVNYWKRFAPEQIREFRFRGGSYLSSATNTKHSVGGTSASGNAEITSDSAADYTIAEVSNIGNYILVPYGGTTEASAHAIARAIKIGRSVTVNGTTYNDGTFTVSDVSIFSSSNYYVSIAVSESILNYDMGTGAETASVYGGEFDKLFVSPSMVGADFVNVYSNAIFFSDTGDGKTTSFTDFGEDWLNSGTDTKTPTGLYFVPEDSSSDPYFSFWHQNTSAADGGTGDSEKILEVGGQHGFWYTGAGGFSLSQSAVASAMAYVFGYRGLLITDDAPILIQAMATSSGNANVAISGDDEITLTSLYGPILISSYDDMTIESTDGNVDIDGETFSATASTGGAWLTAETTLVLRSGSGDTSITAADGAVNLVSADHTNINLYNSKSLYIYEGAVTGEYLKITPGSSTYLSSSGAMHLVAYSGDIVLNPSEDLVFSTLSDVGSGNTLKITSGGVVFQQSSSIRFKNTINDINDSSIIYDLRPVSFKYNGLDNTNYGFIAEEVDLIDKNLVNYEVDNVTPKGVNYEEIIPLLVKEIQNLRKELDELKG